MSESKMDDWKKGLGVIVAFVVVVAALLYAAGFISDIFPSSDDISAWSVQEAIFYGACAVAAATFLR